MTWLQARRTPPTAMNSLTAGPDMPSVARHAHRLSEAAGGHVMRLSRSLLTCDVCDRHLIQ